MVIITTILIAVTLAVAQINPISIVRDNFLVEQSEAKVLGVSEEGEEARKADSEAGQQSISNGFPKAEFKDSRPIKKLNAETEFEITASSAIAIDADTKHILFRKNVGKPSAIASITKLMTALVVLDKNPDLSKSYVMQSHDRREGGRIFLFNGDRVTINDLFNISLVGSGNTATIALVHAIGMDEKEFVKDMNEKAKELGLSRTSFADPIGLSSKNISNAYDVAKLLDEALSRDKIKEAVLQDRYLLRTEQGKSRVISSTDYLLSQNKNYQILGGKTGYLGSAGFCFSGKFSKKGNEIITVVLDSESMESRFFETEEIVDWVYDNYFWP